MEDPSKGTGQRSVPEPPEERLARHIRAYASSCGELGSPLYAELLRRSVEDVLAGGPVAQVLAGHERDSGPSALALRLLGGVHRLVLTGRAPDLARFYPSVGGTATDPAAAWAAFRQVVGGFSSELRSTLDMAPQTNEVGRAAPLLGALCHLTARSPLPMHSIMWQYLPEAERHQVTAGLARLGAVATPDRPLAHVAFEPRQRAADKPPREYVVVVRVWPAAVWPAAVWPPAVWPGGDEGVLGSAPPHGLPVTWE